LSDIDVSWGALKFIIEDVMVLTGWPSRAGSPLTSYSLLPEPFFLGTMLMTGSAFAAVAGWKELKKSSPPKSMSNFFALSDLT